MGTKTPLRYEIKSSLREDILTHLTECNNNFSPSLSDRVNLGEYAEKIFVKALTFEAWADHRLVGLIAVYIGQSEPYITFVTNVSVVRNFARRGIATELLTKCIAYARNLKQRQIVLEVSPTNSHAVSFYKKFDFKQLGQKSGFISLGLSL